MKQVRTLSTKQKSLHRKESLKKEMDWVDAAYLVVIAVALPLLALQFLDSLTLFGVHVQNDIWRGRIIFWARWLAVPLFAISSYAVARLGIQGIYLALFGIFITLFVVFNFRADFIREGTFDHFEESRWIWMTPVLIGWVLGVLLGLLHLWLAKTKPELRRPSLVWIWLILLGIASYVAYEEAVIRPTTEWSPFAPTRHLGLLFITLMLAIFLSVAEFKRRKP
ncbi:MAG TPA: hypothetical protein VNK96_01955 [Fimbriimonadales bacterium]|nr:hypothetical protein [Fimbriimonadales bacterium]